jgi:hypothetical protein
MKKCATMLMMFVFTVLLVSCDISLGPIASVKGQNYESFERLFDDTKVKTLRVIITKEKWDELDNAMIDYFVRHGHYRTDYMVEANLEFTDQEGIVDIERIGFRTRGNMSRDRIQNDEGEPQFQNFKISFHEDYTPEISKRTVFELEEIDLKGNRNYDETYLTEKFSLDLMKSFGVFAAQTTLVKFLITIGDQTYDYGVYTAFEPIDDNFIKRRLTKEASDGHLYKSLWQNFGPANLGYIQNNRAIGIKNEAINYRPTYDLKTRKWEENHTNLREFIDKINGYNNHDFIQYIEENFEVDMFLRYLAVGALLGNPDDYRAMGNNYYLYQNASTQKWMIIPYDYDHGMGQGWNGGGLFEDWSVGLDIYDWANVNAHLLGQPNYPHVLVDRILSYETYQLTYESYLAELINPENNYFTQASFMSLYEEQKALYDNLLVNSMINNLAFGLRNVMTYIDDKTKAIEQQLTFYQTNPDQR